MSSRQQRRKLQRKRASTRTLQVAAGALALTLVPVAAAQASTVKVTNLNDSGSGSLRAAITAADGVRQAGTELILISSQLSGSIDLETPLPPVTRSIDLHGAGARKVTINGKAVPTDSGSLLSDTTKNAELSVVGLSFTDSTQEHGGFIHVKGAKLKLSGDEFTHGSTDGSGGALYTSGSTAVSIDDCTFAHNSSDFGGAIEMLGTHATIDDSTIADNAAQGGGGGIGSTGSELTITGTTISGNAVSYTGTQPSGYGGGLDFKGGKLKLQDSIVAGNTATGNPAIASHGSRHRDIFLYGGATMTARFSLIQHDTTGLPGLNSTDIIGKNPDLGPLRINGGGLETELPTGKSPVINAGRAFGLKTDERGLKRTFDYPGIKKRHGSDGTDIGAVELQGPHK